MNIVELRRLHDLEPNPARKYQYSEMLKAAEATLKKQQEEAEAAVPETVPSPESTTAAASAVKRKDGRGLMQAVGMMGPDAKHIIPKLQDLIDKGDWAGVIKAVAPLLGGAAMAAEALGATIPEGLAGAAAAAPMMTAMLLGEKTGDLSKTEKLAKKFFMPGSPAARRIAQAVRNQDISGLEDPDEQDEAAKRIQRMQGKQAPGERESFRDPGADKYLEEREQGRRHGMGYAAGDRMGKAMRRGKGPGSTKEGSVPIPEFNPLHSAGVKAAAELGSIASDLVELEREYDDGFSSGEESSIKNLVSTVKNDFVDALSAWDTEFGAAAGDEMRKISYERLERLLNQIERNPRTAKRLSEDELLDLKEALQSGQLKAPARETNKAIAEALGIDEEELQEAAGAKMRKNEYSGLVRALSPQLAQQLK